MNKFFGLVLLSAVAAVGAERINVNDPLDRLIEKMNDQQRQAGITMALVPEIQVDPEVKYSRAEFLGVDSLKRTADCWREIRGNDATVDISYGFQLLTIVLPQLEIAGTNMSAYARIRDNSVHLSYTIHRDGEECRVKLNELRVEKMRNVEFASSRAEYDGSNLDGFFESVIVPKLNGIVDANFARIEKSLQGLCEHEILPNEDPVLELVRSITTIRTNL